MAEKDWGSIDEFDLSGSTDINRPEPRGVLANLLYGAEQVGRSGASLAGNIIDIASATMDPYTSLRKSLAGEPIFTRGSEWEESLFGPEGYIPEAGSLPGYIRAGSREIIPALLPLSPLKYGGRALSGIAGALLGEKVVADTESPALGLATEILTGGLADGLSTTVRKGTPEIAREVAEKRIKAFNFSKSDFAKAGGAKKVPEKIERAGRLGVFKSSDPIEVGELATKKLEELSEGASSIFRYADSIKEEPFKVDWKRTKAFINDPKQVPAHRREKAMSIFDSVAKPNTDLVKESGGSLTLADEIRQGLNRDYRLASDDLERALYRKIVDDWRESLYDSAEKALAKTAQIPAEISPELGALVRKGDLPMETLPGIENAGKLIRDLRADESALLLVKDATDSYANQAMRRGAVSRIPTPSEGAALTYAAGKALISPSRNNLAQVAAPLVFGAGRYAQRVGSSPRAQLAMALVDETYGPTIERIAALSRGFSSGTARSLLERDPLAQALSQPKANPMFSDDFGSIDDYE